MWWQLRYSVFGSWHVAVWPFISILSPRTCLTQHVSFFGGGFPRLDLVTSQGASFAELSFIIVDVPLRIWHYRSWSSTRLEFQNGVFNSDVLYLVHGKWRFGRSYQFWVQGRAWFKAFVAVFFHFDLGFDLRTSRGNSFAGGSSIIVNVLLRIWDYAIWIPEWSGAAIHVVEASLFCIWCKAYAGLVIHINSESKDVLDSRR